MRRAGPFQTPVTRRDALRLLSAGLASSLAACKPASDILPYVIQPDGLAPGVPQRFATCLPLSGYGRGVLATSVDGRPIKIAGNELHPASQGATDVFCEADILGLYDPERSQTPRSGRIPQSWQAFETALRRQVADGADPRGGGLRILTGRVTSPTVLRQIERLRAGPYPDLRWHRYEPVGDDHARQGARQAFGRTLDVLPHLDRCDVVLSLAADPLGPGPDQIRNGRAFAERRTVRGEHRDMLRLYVAEPVLSLTGAASDHRRALTLPAVERLARILAARMGAPSSPGEADADSYADAIAADLLASRGRALVLVGEEMSPEIHALGHWMNQTLGAFGQAAALIEPVDPHPEDHRGSIAALAADLRAGAVDTLLILGANPAYDAPADLEFADAIERARFSLHLGLFLDETAERCTWHLPESHPLEGWGDLRSVDGTAAVAQPLIEPLYATRTAAEILGLFLGDRRSGRDLVRETWAGPSGTTDFEAWWRRTVQAGVVPASAAPPVDAVFVDPRRVGSPPVSTISTADPSLALVIRPDPTVWDGRYASNAWLQECPKPVTAETWGNTLRLAPDDAARLGLATGDAVRIERDGGIIEAPLLVDRGLATGVAALSLGYGRTRAGPIGTGLGADAYRMRTTVPSSEATGLVLTKVGTAEAIPRLQWKLDEDGRDLAPRISLADLAKPPADDEPKEPPPSIFANSLEPGTPRAVEADTAWAMVIDTTLCIGCNACVVACQSENNVPVVGPDEIRRGRDMHWLRIDTYDKNPEGTAEPVFQPVPCMHCETAPCEPVCPVGASVHDHEGLNVQVYNRCVGTRFCQANCPYKVRRFNFFGYGDGQEYANMGDAPLPAQLNPDVTVRVRGVMEKCTYCVQRISGARRQAETEGRPLREGEVVTACAAACPTRAIAFGDLKTEHSRIRALRAEPQHHVLLEEVGTRPRTTYLARLRNDNPALGEQP